MKSKINATTNKTNPETRYVGKSSLNLQNPTKASSSLKDSELFLTTFNVVTI